MVNPDYSKQPLTPEQARVAEQELNQELEERDARLKRARI